MTDNFSEWTYLIIKAAQAAYHAIKGMAGTPEARELLTRGAGGDITSRIDQIAENKILQSLENSTKDFIVDSEEIGKYYWNSSHRKRYLASTTEFSNSQCSDYLIIDPIDGSTNAMRGIPFCCISIAYATGDSINSLFSGVILDIATGKLYVAEKGIGAFVNGQKISGSPVIHLKEAIMATDLDSSIACKDIVARKESLFDSVYKRRVMGSCALVLALVAEGAFDLYFDIRGVLRFVDIAAGILLVLESRGFVVDSQGNSIADLKFTEKFQYDLIAGCQGLEKEMTRILKENE